MDFASVSLSPLTHAQQEDLIRARMAFLTDGEIVTDGKIDQIEKHVNSIITSRRIVPRYPFFVLSILQTYESFLPEMHVTSYGYCYHVLIVANIVKSGIPRTDDGIGTAFIFAERLAFSLYCHDKNSKKFDFLTFVRDYDERFIIPKAILSRLQHSDYGIIFPDGKFRNEYMYFYFVGLYLSRDTRKYRTVIEGMCDDIHVSRNYLTLLFIIHHTNDIWIIDEILTRVKCSFGTAPPATLVKEETIRFGELVDALSSNILSDRDVTTYRREVRDIRDASDSHDVFENVESGEPENFGSYCYRMLRNFGILGQVLRNKYGILERSRVDDIIEAVSDASLRAVNSLLRDEKEIEHRAHYFHRKYPQLDVGDLQSGLRFLSLLWTMVHIDGAVDSISHPDIRDVVDKVVRRKSTPAYDLIGYSSRLRGALELTEGIRNVLWRVT